MAGIRNLTHLAQPEASVSRDWPLSTPKRLLDTAVPESHMPCGLLPQASTKRAQPFLFSGLPITVISLILLSRALGGQS